MKKKASRAWKRPLAGLLTLAMVISLLTSAPLSADAGGPESSQPAATTEQETETPQDSDDVKETVEEKEDSEEEKDSEDEKESEEKEDSEDEKESEEKEDSEKSTGEESSQNDVTDKTEKLQTRKIQKTKVNGAAASQNAEISDNVQRFLAAVDAIEIPDTVDEITSALLNEQLSEAMNAYEALTEEELEREDVLAAVEAMSQAMNVLTGEIEPMALLTGEKFSIVVHYGYLSNNQFVETEQKTIISTCQYISGHSGYNHAMNAQEIVKESGYSGEWRVTRYGYWSSSANTTTVNYNITGGEPYKADQAIWVYSDDAKPGGGDGDREDLGGSGSNTIDFSIVYHSNYPNGTDNTVTIKYTVKAYTSSTNIFASQLKSYSDLSFVGYTPKATERTWYKTAECTQAYGSVYVSNGGTYHLYAGWQDDTPEKPDKPSDETVKELLKNGAVKIDCTNTEINPEHADETYGLIDGTFTVGEVKGDAQAGYTCTVTVTNPAPYVTQYNTDVASGHTLSPETQSSKKITLKYDSEEWVVDSGAPVIYTVICETPDPGPEKPDWDELDISKTVDKATANPGETLTYTITVTNNTGRDLKNLEVKDELADTLEFDSADPANQYDSATGIWTIPSLENVKAATLTIQAKVKEGTSAGTITNTATITAAETGDGDKLPTEGDKPNDSADVTVEEQNPQEKTGRVVLSIYKDGDTSEPAVSNVVIGTYPVGTDMREIAETIDLDEYYTKNKNACGYEFDGKWYKDGSVLKWELDDSSTVKESDWNRITCMVYDQYKVRYHIDGTIELTDIITAKNIAEYKLWQPEEKQGYTFDGWYEKKADIGNEKDKVKVPLGLKKYELYGTYVAKEYPVYVQVYRDGKTEEPAVTVNLGNYPYGTAYSEILNNAVIDGKNAELTTKDGLDQIYEPAKFASGYEWDGVWSQEVSNLGTDMTDRTVNGWTNLCTMVYDRYAVNYHIDGEETVTEYITAKTIKDYELLKAPEKQGHTFDGWYEKKADIGNEKDKVKVPLGLKKYELYGAYVAKEYPVYVYVYRDGKTEEPAVTINLGEYPYGTAYSEILQNAPINGVNAELTTKDGLDKLYKPAKFASGYEWDGVWSHEASNLGTDMTDRTVNGWTNLCTMVYDRYAVNYHIDGEETVTEYITAKTIKDYEFLKVEEKEGYTFDGWYEKKADIGNESKKEPEPLTVLKKYELYGAYNAHTYTIEYHGNGGFLTRNPQKDVTTFTHTYGVEVALKNAKTFTREGYTFLGWAMNPDDTEIQFEGSQKVMNLATEQDSVVRLYALWIPNASIVDPAAAAYKVQHYLENTDGTYSLQEVEFPLYGEIGTEVTAQAGTYEHYTLNTAHTDSQASGVVTMPQVDADTQELMVLTLKLYYDLDRHTVTFQSGGHGILDGREVEMSGTYRYGAAHPAAPVVTAEGGYVFDGWYAGAQKIDKFPATVTADAVYVAKYKDDKNQNGVADDAETKYSVTYTDGVDGEEIFKDQVYTNLLSGADTPVFVGKLTRDGYVFKGWDPVVAPKVNGNAVYKAVWEKTDSGNSGNGSGSSSSSSGSGSGSSSGTISSPKTGDTSPVLPFALIGALALAGIVITVSVRKKNKCSGGNNAE